MSREDRLDEARITEQSLRASGCDHLADGLAWLIAEVERLTQEARDWKELAVRYGWPNERAISGAVPTTVTDDQWEAATNELHEALGEGYGITRDHARGLAFRVLTAARYMRAGRAAVPDELILALRNVMAYTRRALHRGTINEEDAGHLLRFCAEVGVKPSILRAGTPASGTVTHTREGT